MKMTIHSVALISLLTLADVVFAADRAAEPFTAWFWHASAAGSVYHLNDEGSPYRFSLGAGHPVVTKHIILMADLVYTLYDVNANADNNPGQDVQGGLSSSLGFDLLLRLNLVRTARAALYLEGGGGFQVMVDDPPFPADGSEENFTLFGGPGISLPTWERSRLTVSVQWFHISNGNLIANNSGYDGVQLVLGTEHSF